MTNDAKKTARQQQILAKWIKQGCRGVVVAVTGFGKTRIALMAIKAMNERHPSRITIVGVPGIDLKTQWEILIAEWGLLNVQVVVDKSLVKMLDNGKVSCDLLVLDETHEWASINASRVFAELNYRFLLGLTATLERADQRHHIILRYAPIIDTVAIEEALREGYVSPFRVFNLGIELPPAQRKKYDDMNREFHKYFSVFSHDLKQAMACLASVDYAEEYAKGLHLDVQDVRTSAFQFNRNMGLRKKFLYEHPLKLEVTKELIDALPVSTITFSQTTDIPMKLQQMMPDISVDYGSHLKDKQRKLNLQRFADDPRIRVIHTAKALDRGKDIAGLEMAIVLAATSAVIQTIQRDGRTLRKMPKKQAVIINPYIIDTQDEKWLRARQEKTINISWVNSVEQLLQKLGKTIHPVSDREQLILV